MERRKLLLRQNMQSRIQQKILPKYDRQNRRWHKWKMVICFEKHNVRLFSPVLTYNEIVYSIRFG